MALLVRDKQLGTKIVPIVPDVIDHQHYLRMELKEGVSRVQTHAEV